MKAQQTPVAPRIVGAVDESVLTTLRGGVSGLARAEYDRGRAQASTQMTSVRLVLSRTPQQEAALEEFLREQNDPGSPNYHHWLTPQQYGQLYGPADTDIDTLVTWLQSQGFTVQPVAPGRTSIAFSGSVAQMEAAFHTEIHSFDTGREQFIANTTNPRIPSALASVVAGLAHFNTIHPRPHSVLGSRGKFDPETRRLARADADENAASPLLYGSNGGFYITAADAATIYDSPNKYNGSFNTSGSTPSYTGTGVTIGIGGQALIQTSTVQNYRTLFVGDSAAPTITNVSSDPATTCSPSASNCAQDEAYLDVETAGALAPGATVHFYASANLYDGIEQAITENTVDIFSLSFGLCEAEMTTSDNAYLNNLWQEFSAQGVPVTVSSGDSGSAGCDSDSLQVAQYGLQVSGFASTPYNIAVGGTDFYGLATDLGQYVGTTNSASNYYRTAIKYIPESTWNESTSINTAISANVPYKDSTTGKGNIVAGSGGASSCSTNKNANDNSTSISNCTSGYAKPSWQRGAGVPSDSVRDIPDVSLMAGAGTYDAAWLVCTDDTQTVSGKTVTYNCGVQSGSFGFVGFGGTSASAPAFAGILALVQQKTGSRLGLAAKNLYDLYNSTFAGEVFHDITVGNNSVPCTSGTPNCAANAGSYYFMSGFNTTTGYDEATGLGSVDATQLVSNWTAAELPAPTVTVTPGATNITTDQTLSVAVTVTGASSTPTGTVTLTSGTYSSGAQALTSGAYTFTIPIGKLAAGIDTLTVAYSGDSNYNSTTQTASVNVTALVPTTTITPGATTIASNKALDGTVSVSGSGPTPTGTITLTVPGWNSGALTLSSGSVSFSIPANTLTVGVDTITAGYSGDAIYGSGGGAVNVTVTAVPVPTVSVTPASASITTIQSLSVPVAVSGSSGTPTGTVTLTSGSYSSGAQTLAAGAYTFNVPAGALATGSDTLAVAYNGDNTYGSATGTAAVTVTKAAAAVGVTPASSSIVSTQPLGVSIKVTGAGATPTGTATLTAGSYTSSAVTLSSGAASFTIPANTFTAAGAQGISVSYSGDSVYSSSTGTASVTVSLPLVPTIVVTPASSSINSGQPLAVSISVAGTGAAPTGTVTLTSGGYTSSAATLTAGAVSITIPANSLAAGTDTLRASYSGDTNYVTGAGTGTVTVTQSAFSLAGPSTQPSANPGSSASATVTVSSSTNYNGTVSLACALTNSPGGAATAYNPTCSITGSPVTLSSATASATATVNFGTTAPSSAAVRGTLAGGNSGWWKSGAATLLALVVFFGIPARRRAWRAMLGVVVLIAAFGALTACGGGSSNGGGGNSTPGTTAGNYTFTITGTPSVSGTAAQTTSITLTVN